MPIETDIERCSSSSGARAWDKFTSRKADIEHYLSKLKSCVVAYSGGIDSTLVSYLAKQVLREHAIIVSFVTPLISQKEIRHAKRVSDELGLDALFVNLDPLYDEHVRFNEERRCYYCKHALFSKLANLYQNVPLLDGTNLDDLGEHRPGLLALEELSVVSPLAELQFTKHDIRLIAEELLLPNARKHSAPCLATRFEHGKEILPENLARIEQSEAHIARIYKGDFRIRLRDQNLVFELK